MDKSEPDPGSLPTAERPTEAATEAMPLGAWAARPPGTPAAAAPDAEETTAPGVGDVQAGGQDGEAAAARAIAAGGRYRIEGLLGRGGMGFVFRAHDGRLGRTVAIKALAASGAAAAARLEREAQLQARVDHPNVAKVYETGEAQGMRFIVMQFIPGKPLSALAESLSLEEKVRLVQRVAEGVHEAHRLGLVHSDLKPKNVLVVAVEQGGWHPYVLDFGIAREVAAAGAAGEGATITGTPAYMAPEQARGEPLDRRTDVYALGVMLFRLLSGRLPYREQSTRETLERVLHEPAPPLRHVAPDLEAIVRKCLAKAPAERYATARGLADDLVRWLDGEPVLARPQTRLYRLATRVRKNRVLVAVSLAALAGVLAASGWAVGERLQTARRAELAQRFGREEERFEWTLRAAYELPLHDTSGERNAVGAAIARLDREVRGLRPALRAPGDAALGRGLLALGDDAQARRHLEAAWRAGNRAPELAYALGLTLVHAYQEALARARLARDESERQLALASARRRLRDPALAYLQASRGGDLVASQYLEALLAYLAGDSATTLVKSRAAIARLPWLYEALALQAQAWRARTEQAPDEAGRAAALAQAEAALTQAVRLGASDASLYLGLCETEIEQLQEAVYGTGVGVAPLCDRAVAACDAALRAEPRFSPALAAKAEALTLTAGFALEHGADPEPRLRQAEAAAATAIRLAGGDAQPHRALAAVWNLRARALRHQGGDVRQALRPAIASLEQALRCEPDDWLSLADLGNALGQRAIQEGEHGEDAAASFAASVAALERSAAIEPNLYTTRFNLGRTYADWGEFRAGHGQDPTAVQERAVAAYHRAIAMKPSFAQAYNSLGAVLFFRASQPRPGMQPMALLEDARVALARSIAIQPTYANPHFNLGLVFREMGNLEDAAGSDPWPHLRQAIAAFGDGLRLNPKIFFAYIELGRIYVIGGRHDVRLHRSPLDSTAAAVRLADRSLAMQPDDFMALKMRAEAHMAEADWALEQKRSPNPLLTLAQADIERAAQVNANDFGAYELLGDVHRAAARARLDAGQSAAPEIDQGLAAIAKGRQIAGEDQPGLLAVAGGLYLARAEAASAPAARTAAARMAVASFERAARLRPPSATQLAPELARARQLAASAGS
jgi:eukaryotic-like serine/threonine-protein kinase